jgi:hypothetical protein
MVHPPDAAFAEAGCAHRSGDLDRAEPDDPVVAKLDRLTRSLGDWDRIIADYFGERTGRIVSQMVSRHYMPSNCPASLRSYPV